MFLEMGVALPLASVIPGAQCSHWEVSCPKCPLENGQKEEQSDKEISTCTRACTCIHMHTRSWRSGIRSDNFRFLTAGLASLLDLEEGRPALSWHWQRNTSWVGPLLGRGVVGKNGFLKRTEESRKRWTHLPRLPRAGSSSLTCGFSQWGGLDSG